jgi:hypothetical protein
LQKLSTPSASLRVLGLLIEMMGRLVVTQHAASSKRVAWVKGPVVTKQKLPKYLLEI